ncbi:MAG: DMT family transporter [Sulfuricurvum sp.]|nr:DMT family transporter [Sulfuricurvum sp.]
MNFYEKSSYKIALFSIFTAAIGWALAGIFIRLLPTFKAYEIVSLRFIFAFVFLSFFLIIKLNSRAIINDLKQHITWIYAIIMLSCYYIGTTAFQLAPVGETTLLMSIAPIYVIIHQLWTKQYTSPREKQGGIVALIGIIIFFISNFSSTNYTAEHCLGNFLALTVAFLFAIYALMHSRKNIYSPSSFSVTYAMLLLSLIPSIYYLQSSIIINQNILLNNIFILAGLGIVSTAIPTIAITVASKYLPPVITSSVLLLETIFGTLLAFVFLNESPGSFFLLSTVIVLSGLLFMITKRKK